MPFIPCPVIAHARHNARQSAILWAGRSITWDQLNNYVHSTSRYLKEIALRPQQRVLLVADKTPSFYIVLLALWRIGAVPCIVRNDASVQEAEQVRLAFKPDLLISGRTSKELWGGKKGPGKTALRAADIEHVVAYGYNDVFLGSEVAQDPSYDEADIALLRYTQTPMGIDLCMFSHAQLTNDPGDLSPFFQALRTGAALVI